MDKVGKIIIILNTQNIIWKYMGIKNNLKHIPSKSLLGNILFREC